MPANAAIPFKNFPFLRLLIALTAGIILQWYLQITYKEILLFTGIAIILLTAFYILPSSKKFLLNWLRGLFMLLLFACFGMILTWQQNIHNNKNWYWKIYSAYDEMLITIQEPLVEKANSYKALATINAIYKNDKWISTTGNVLLYFKKDASKPFLQYGSEIILDKPLQAIQNSGNPAALDYNRYCLFQDITNQVFLSEKDYKILSVTNTNAFQKILFNIRDWALQILKQNIHSPKELGIAEALLIGYRNDLDKDLVQAYSNTGVVHIIAISGLHIGVIYGALVLFFSLFKSSKLKKWIEPLIILLVIWSFTLIAGAAPSVLRATVMFTFILAGKFLGKHSNIYNTLTASAFVLLVSNPFFLWDVGFQLSYTAVLSIVIFFKSINSLLYFKNKIIRWIWGLSAVSLSAQVFTLPLVIYHFHQLPLLFLFSNLLAVPLSGIILLEELILFSISWWHSTASAVGWLTELCVKWMNDFIEHINKFAFSVWDGLYISIIQLVMLFIIIAFFSVWIFSKNTKVLLAALSSMIVFYALRDADVVHHKTQQKFIVYNVPKQTSIDIFQGNNCRFAGDSILLINPFLKNFNLKPSRVKYRVYTRKDVLLPAVEGCALKINSSEIIILGKGKFIHPKQKIAAKILVLSNKVNQSASELNDVFICSYFVADSSIPEWKAAQLKKEFEQLHLRFYSVAQDGAFIVNL